MAKHALPGEGQLAFFSPQDVAVEEAARIQTYEPEHGPAVDISNRAAELGAALRALNQANMRQGLQVAAATDKYPDIDRRYGLATPSVVAGAARKQEEDINRAKHHFANASGMNALIAAGMDSREAKRLTRESWDDFTARYGVGVSDAATRNRKAKALGKAAAKIRSGRAG